MTMRIAALLIVVSMVGCSESKKLQNSIERVLNDTAATNIVGRAWEKTHPCANDSVFIHGRTDTLIETNTIELECDSVGNVIEKGTGKPVSKAVNKKTTINQTDTIVVVDRRREKILTDDLAECNFHVTALQASIDDLTTALAKQAKRENWIKWKERLKFGLPLLLLILGFIFKQRIPLLKNL